MSNKEVWFPEGCDFDSLPPSWNINARPSPNAPPSAYLLSLPGISLLLTHFTFLKYYFCSKPEEHERSKGY